jgi:hypothetical protein
MKVSGTTRLTASGVVGTSGAQIRVWKLLIGSTATPANVKLRNGTSTSGAIFVEDAGLANQNARNVAGMGATGMLFPSGCYCEMDANTTAVVIGYTQE